MITGRKMDRRGCKHRHENWQKAKPLHGQGTKAAGLSQEHTASAEKGVAEKWTSTPGWVRHLETQSADVPSSEDSSLHSTENRGGSHRFLGRVEKFETIISIISDGREMTWGIHQMAGQRLGDIKGQVNIHLCALLRQHPAAPVTRRGWWAPTSVLLHSSNNTLASH